jgi:hypothetical protein
VEHENVGKMIVTALNDIADCLPRVELAALLYPTDTMQQTVAMLYAHIVRFLIRAMEWYEESRLTHVLHSITRPASLRYDDLIKEIQRETKSITDHALASSQAEQRDMHNAIREIRNLSIGKTKSEQEDVLDKLSSLTAMVVQLRESLALDQAVNASARIEFRCRLTDIQITQALSFISLRCNIDHTSTFRTAIAVRDRHRLSSKLNSAQFWTSPKLREWDASLATSTILLSATFRQRLEIRDFCASVVEQLVNNQTVSLWILRDRTREYSLLEVFKSLILQALSLDYTSHTDLQFSFQLQKFLDSHLDEDFVNVLGDILQHFKLVYIIADTGAMSADVADQCSTYLQQLSEGLAKRDAKTVLKIIVSSYGSARKNIQQPARAVMLNVGRTSGRVNKRKSKRHSRKAGNILGTSALRRKAEQ